MASINIPRADKKTGDGRQFELAEAVNRSIGEFENELAKVIAPLDDVDEVETICGLAEGICEGALGEDLIEFALPAWAHGGEQDWISPDPEPDVSSEQLIVGHAARYLTVCRRKKILHYSRPKQTKLKCRGLKCTLYCRSAQDRFYVEYCHPSIDEVLGDAITCTGIALVAAGGAAAIVGSGAWPAFVGAWRTCMTQKVGGWATAISLNLRMEKWRGPWGKC